MGERISLIFMFSKAYATRGESCLLDRLAEDAKQIVASSELVLERDD